MYRVANNIHEPFDVLRRTKPYWHVEYFLGQFHGTFHFGAATRNDQPVAVRLAPSDEILGAGDAIEATAKSLPYVDGFAG